MRILIVLVLAVACGLTYAEEVSDQKEETREGWQTPPEVTVTPSYEEPQRYAETLAPNQLRRTDTYFMLGATISPKSKYRTVFQGIDRSYTDTDKSAVAFGVDSVIRFTPLFGMSIVSGLTLYKYSDGTPSDKIVDFGLGPRIAIQARDFEFWINAIAACAVNVWGKSYDISNGYIAHFSDDRSIAFQFSSRVGIDYNLMDLVKFRIQGGYTTAQYDVDVSIKTYPGFSEVATGSGRVERSYWTALGGIAILF